MLGDYKFYLNLEKRKIKDELLNNMKITYRPHYGFIIFSEHDSLRCHPDLNIAKLLCMPINEYQQYILDNYNSKLINGNIYFRNEDHAREIIEWIIGRIIMNEMLDSNI